MFGRVRLGVTHYLFEVRSMSLSAILEGYFDPPVVDCEPHLFVKVEGNRYCGACGAGELHQVHTVIRWPTIHVTRIF